MLREAVGASGLPMGSPPTSFENPPWQEVGADRRCPPSQDLLDESKDFVAKVHTAPKEPTMSSFGLQQRKRGVFGNSSPAKEVRAPER